MPPAPKAKSPATPKQQLNAKNLSQGEQKRDPHKPGNVRDKIQKWQAAVAVDDAGEDTTDAPKPNDGGAASASPNDTGAAVKEAVDGAELAKEAAADASATVPPAAPDASAEAPPAEANEEEKTAGDEAVQTPTKGKPNVNKDPNIRTAPKKRVVSDGHWRKKSPPKNTKKDKSPPKENPAENEPSEGSKSEENKSVGEESKPVGEENKSSPQRQKTQLVWVRPAVKPRIRAQQAAQQRQKEAERRAKEKEKEKEEKEQALKPKLESKDSSEIVVEIPSEKNAATPGEEARPKEPSTPTPTPKRSRRRKRKPSQNAEEKGGESPKSDVSGGTNSDKTEKSDSPEQKGTENTTSIISPSPSQKKKASPRSPPQVTRKPRKPRRKSSDDFAGGVCPDLDTLMQARRAGEMLASGDTFSKLTKSQENDPLHNWRSTRRPEGDPDQPTQTDKSPGLEELKREERRHRRKRSNKVEETIERLLSPDRTPPPSSRSLDRDPPRRHRKSRSAENSRDSSLQRDHKDLGSTRRHGSRRQSIHETRRDEATPPADTEPSEETTPKVFGSRVEAWLTSTPDKFEDESKTKRKTSRGSSSKSHPDDASSDHSPRSLDDDTGKPHRHKSKHGSRRSRRRRSHESDDPFTQNDDHEPSHHRRRSRKSDDISTVPDSLDDSFTSPVPPLKRSGARRSPRTPTQGRSRSKSSPLQHTSHDDDSTLTDHSVDPPPFAPPGLNQGLRRGNAIIRRNFPSTGKRLSTIASVETFNTKAFAVAPSITDVASEVPEGSSDAENIPPSEISCEYDTAILPVKRSSTRRKMAKHADLMSVLSMSKPEGSRSVVSARSVRSNRSRLAPDTMEELMDELTSDESKYMRELRTLVDGVVPVLLSAVLSKSESAVAAGLFGKGVDANDPNVTRPIVDMGIALERLKSSHKRIPLKSSDSLLTWAKNAQRIYSDYLKCWRMGFQDVVVNLAPLEDKPKSSNDSSKESEWDAGLARNTDGDVVGADGGRVDVAFLLKRPLVRLKYLAKTFKAVNVLNPSSQAQEAAEKYQSLVEDARKRAYEERARLEDQAAAQIDPSRARDPQSLVPLSGVCIDATRCVRARDYFDMHILHSSGQEIDCRVELLLRDDAPGRGKGGDLLVCEMEGSSRWLFLPPIQLNRVSAREGRVPGDIVIMIRGFHSTGKEWRELLSLRCSDEHGSSDWVDMLGTKPYPPQLDRTRSFGMRSERPTSSHGSSLVSGDSESTAPLKSRTPSPGEIQIPFGEKAGSNSKPWGVPTPDGKRVDRKSPDTSPITSDSENESGFDSTARFSPGSPTASIENSLIDDVRHVPISKVSTPTPSPVKHSAADPFRHSHPRKGAYHSSPRSDDDIVYSRRSTKERDPGQGRPYTPTGSETSQGFKVWFPATNSDLSDEEWEDSEVTPRANRVGSHQRTSSVPALDLPSVNKLRKAPPRAPPTKDIHGAERDELPSSAPAKLQKRRPPQESDRAAAAGDDDDDDLPPPPPPHRKGSVIQPKSSPTVQFSANLPTYKSHRRTSSPLKHEYEPSTATESDGTDSSVSSESDGSESSDGSDFEEYDAMPAPLRPVKKGYVPSPPVSTISLPDATLGPSQSASQAPYRTVPVQGEKASTTIGSIFSWADAGRWDLLHMRDCTISVTPGLIEAFEMVDEPATVNGSGPKSVDLDRPLIALELTPLVQIRRGTALDITIRSPPTANSRLKASNNIMFRSRTSEECETLYHYINQARMNNPTWLALQNARGPHGESWAEVMDRRNDARTSESKGRGSSMWSFKSGLSGLSRSKSYRSRSYRAPSNSAATDSSVKTMGTAFSAFKRLSGGGLFTLTRSHFNSSRGDSFDSYSGSGGSGSSTPNGRPGSGMRPDAPMGPLGMQTGAIASARIRLYERETGSKWRDMGSARLSILQPSGSRGNGGGVVGSHGASEGTSEKRVLVSGKTKGETLLDVTLSESCFERIARTGVAISVWEDVVGPNGEIGTVNAIGGVGGARSRVFMVQLKTEREAAFIFSLVGRLRY